MNQRSRAEAEDPKAPGRARSWPCIRNTPSAVPVLDTDDHQKSHLATVSTSRPHQRSTIPYHTLRSITSHEARRKQPPTSSQTREGVSSCQDP